MKTGNTLQALATANHMPTSVNCVFSCDLRYRSRVPIHLSATKILLGGCCCEGGIYFCLICCFSCSIGMCLFPPLVLFSCSPLLLGCNLGLHSKADHFLTSVVSRRVHHNLFQALAASVLHCNSAQQMFYMQLCSTSAACEVVTPVHIELLILSQQGTFPAAEAGTSTFLHTDSFCISGSKQLLLYL